MTVMQGHKTLSIFFTLILPIYINVCSSESEMFSMDDQVVGQDDGMTPALTKNEMYRDLLHLTNDNFTDIVLKAQDPWIIVFHDDNIYKPWKTMATTMRGIVWMGLVHKEDEKTLDQLKISSGDIPPAMVIHYNYLRNARTRREKAVRVQTPLEARKRAVSSIPDHTIKLEKDNVQDFLVDSYMGHPARFPAIFLTYERETPALIKALSLRFSRYFHFGIMHDPSDDDLKAVGLENQFLELPVLLVLVTPDYGPMNQEEVPELNALFFDQEKMGDMNYPNVMQFFFQINNEFRATLPGDSMASDKEVMTMSDIIEIEQIRFDIIGDDANKRTFLRKDEL